MQRWRGPLDVPDDWGRSVVTIGVFDGVHLGHQRIVARAVESSAELGLPAVVITFDPHPDEVVRPGTHPPLLSTPRRERELLAGLGVDAVLILPFTLEFSQLGPDEFVRAVLVDRLHAARVVVGAAHDLGRPHRVEGVVVRGHQRGRALGFPTANLETPPHTAIPADGIYAGWLARLDTDGTELERWPAAISVGTNPTFDGREQTVEAYALDRDDLDLYGDHVAVDFVSRLRPTVKFRSVAELVTQMHADVDDARRLLTAS